MKSYRDSHKGPNRGKVYDERYARGYTAEMWDRVERPLLLEVFGKYGGASRRCLDFACGTGRITQLLQSAFGQVTGLDVSPDMLAQARKKCPDVEFVCGNLLDDPNLVGQFDVITSFRFFPNAEPELRAKVMPVLAGHLKPGGVMIVNNHQNSRSLLGVMRKIHGSSREFMAPEAMPGLLAAGGLAVQESFGFGKIPVWRDWALVPAGVISRIERKMVSRGDVTDRNLNIIYVAQKA